MSDASKTAPGRSDFLANLGRVYAIYTGGFIGFVLLLALLEQLGVPNKIIGYLFVFLTIGVYALIGIISRTAQLSEYYVAGRRVPAIYNGMATGSDWMSAASFIGMAGTLYLLGYDGLAFVLGWTGGYVLVAILLAPYLRKFGAYTVPDFLGARYGGNFARFVGVIVLMSASFTYVVAQVYGTGIIASRFLGMSFELAVFVGLAGILLCSMLGGMRAVTWTQVAQYIILIIAYLVPVVLLSTQVTGVPIPQIMYGQVLEQIEALRTTKEALAGAPSHVQPFQTYDPLNFFGLIFCLMVGTASLPHILMRYFTTPSVREARQSVAWSLFFIFLLYFTAPAYAAFAKLEVYQNVIGTAIADLPAWVRLWGEVGLVTVRDANGDGILQFREFSINQDAIVLATPEIAGLPYVIAGLVAAGGLAAALSTADGLLLAIANALSHDIYYRMVDPNANAKRRLIVARILLIGVAVVAAYVASTRPAGILAMVAWAFSIAASGLFPALVMGVWWKRTTTAGAIAGMIVGYGVCLYYLIGTQYFGMPLWFGVRNISCGLFGIPAAFLTTWIVSLLTPAPSQAMQDFIDSIRTPRGAVRMIEGEHAPE
ncbi:sodium:solute symporter family protein [Caldovatus aquaticus]|uniref:Cation acetate symporter n=1 Tax=Caldovatus aquaticus TaxID=2865671 RepID=A0ABS7F2P1_9PROT|nr:sodium:solute symporter family protein [Caldovatus aquaticus]MBW8269880.1 cation acetate symporter [Caldovatus aquaticus]